MPRRQFSRLSLSAAAIGALAFAVLAIAPSRAAEEAVVIPAPAVDAREADSIQTAVLAGGCFWGVQGVFQHTAGVINAVSGYSGGSRDSADYDQVSTGRTAHAEAVEVKYDPKKISYGKILQIFFSVAHDPTQLNAAKVYKKPIATKVDRLQAFYAAEDYHQDYMTSHPNQPYIVFNDLPKVENLKKIFAENYIAKPTLVNKPKVTN